MCRYLTSKLDLRVKSFFSLCNELSNLEKSSPLEFPPFVFPGPRKGDPGVPGDHVVVDRQDGLGVHSHPRHLGIRLYQDQGQEQG